jgi:hypothetical protein
VKCQRQGLPSHRCESTRFYVLEGQVPFTLNPLCKQHLLDFVLGCKTGFDVFGVRRECGMRFRTETHPTSAPTQQQRVKLVPLSAHLERWRRPCRAWPPKPRAQCTFPCLHLTHNTYHPQNLTHITFPKHQPARITSSWSGQSVVRLRRQHEG